MYISVIIPSYRPGVYLFDCLNSLNNQTFKKSDYEIILVLNGCDEPFKSCINNKIKEYDFCNIKILQTDEPGVSNARNYGLRESLGEYIAFVDDDDILSPSYLEELKNVSGRYTLGVSNTVSFYGNINGVVEYGNVASSFIPQKTVNLNAGRSYLSGPCMKLIHRDIIGDARFNINFKNGEDTLFMFDISRNVKDLTFTSTDAIYYRRIRKGSATIDQKANWENRLLNLKEIREYLRIWIKHPFSYNILLLMSRIGGAAYAFFFINKIVKKRNSIINNIH